MFRHRKNGKKPDDAFFSDFKSRIWHPPPRPTWETFKLGEDVYVAADGNTPPSTVDVSSEGLCAPRSEIVHMLSPSVFDETVFDFENSRAQSVKSFPPQVAGDCSLEVDGWDQTRKSDQNSPHSWPTISSEWDGVFFPDQSRVLSDGQESPFFMDRICSQRPECRDVESALQTASPEFMSDKKETCVCADSYDEGASLSHSSKRSRFPTILKAPMACTHDHEEMTYLDRDHVYLISICDSASSSMGILSAKYRTTIQVSFETDEQKRPSAYFWDLWLSGQVRKDVATGSRPLKGIEFAQSSTAFKGIHQNVNFHLENTAVDRFTFTWMIKPGEHPQCQIAVTFHFVSTDFNQAKGVRGMPLLLTALTTEINLTPLEQPCNDLYISHCVIKVYRNHGAERKKAIDLKQIQKRIEKISQQIADQENALRAKVNRDQHKRQKRSSEDSPSQSELPADHVLVVELNRLQAAARRPKMVTVFRLRGQHNDGSDRNTLPPGEDPIDFGTSIDQPRNGAPAFSSTQSDNASDIVHTKHSPSKPFVSVDFPMTSQPNELSTLERVTGMATPISNPRLDRPQSPSLIQAVEEDKSPVKPVKRIQVIDAHESNQRSEQLPTKAVLCLYVRVFHPDRDFTAEDYYRAAYLKQRTVRELIVRVADRCGFQTDSSKIVGAFHASTVGRLTMVDDEFVGKMTEEQDMSVELIQAKVEDPQQDSRIDNSAGAMDICVEPGGSAIEYLNK
ncbi:hypothetical protein MMC07_009512, partial [Pseudocyphellaria aurata]|nr:hypothetical protein [Pseudocyphellaria aurata]